MSNNQYIKKSTFIVVKSKKWLKELECSVLWNT